MTLRAKLIVALVVAALLPMAVAMAVPWVRADERARAEAARRLDLARGQAAILGERELRDTFERVGQAAGAIARDRDIQRAFLVGPDQAARDAALDLAVREGLDAVEILGAGGIRLGGTLPTASSGLASPDASLEIDRPVVRRRGSPAGLSADPPVVAVRRGIALESETLSVVGERALDREAIESMAGITGGPVALVDPAGTILAASEAAGPGEAWIHDDVPLAETGWALRVWAPPGDVEAVRRDLLATLAGLAPAALACALLVGFLLAEGISRPVRAVARRAEEIAAERDPSFALLPEGGEVERLTLAFDRMLAALGASERQRLAAERIAAWQEVARRIAHEVKNPLSPIKLAVENLRRTKERAPEAFDRALEEESATILEEVESLRRLVDEFSEFARLPRPEVERCDPRALVAQALALHAGRIRAMGVQVDTDVDAAPETMIADPEQIGRVLKNVVANALDAMESVSDRRLGAAMRRIEPGGRPMVEIEISDSGPGFDPEALRRLFEPYFTTRAEAGGTGLGMAIAYRIVSEHAGTIEARGRKGRGATITVRLPLEGPPPTRA